MGFEIFPTFRGIFHILIIYELLHYVYIFVGFHICSTFLNFYLILTFWPVFNLFDIFAGFHISSTFFLTSGCHLFAKQLHPFECLLKTNSFVAAQPLLAITPARLPTTGQDFPSMEVSFWIYLIIGVKIPFTIQYTLLFEAQYPLLFEHFL